MKVNRKQFIDILEKLSPALGVNPLAPELQYFQIDKGHIQAFDGVLLVDTMTPTGLDFTCAIPREVLSLLASLDTEEIDLVIEGSELRVRTSKLEGKFSLLPLSRFQPLSLVDMGNMKLIDSKLIDDLVEGFSFCKFGVSRDITMGPICGVRIDRGVLFSTNRYRVVKWNLSRDSGIMCSVPLGFIGLLERNQSEISTLGCIEGETLVAILNDGTYISTCVLQGVYPDLQKYFPEAVDYKQIEFDESLTLVIDRHLILLKDIDPSDRRVIVEVRKGVCTFTSKVPEKSNLVERIDVKMKAGLELSFSVNPTFLKEVLSRSSSFKYFDEGLILFETNKFQYLMRTGK